MTYTVRKIYQYTEEVEVEADSGREAKDKASGMEGNRNYDDHLFDCEVIGERDGKPSEPEPD